MIPVGPMTDIDLSRRQLVMDVPAHSLFTLPLGIGGRLQSVIETRF